MKSLAFFLLVGFVSSVSAYGPTGHEIVGGVADKIIANTPTGARVAALIDGITLEKAAVIPDEIKSWDKNGPDDLNAFPHFPDHPKIDKQLRDFWRANPPTNDENSPIPSHHWFHYTDVPVFNNPPKYSASSVGRSQWDIVHMIPYCVGVLRGEVPEKNARKITKSVAVILLAHYVGDIHQPLHVGAEYFNATGQPIDPNKSKPNLADEGGNTIALYLHSGAAETGHRALKLHGFWDNEAVMANLPPMPPEISKEERFQRIESAKKKLIDEFAAKEPANWRLPANVALKDYAETWADEILPIAREAHERLRFKYVHSQLDQDREVAAGTAQEKNAADHVAYADWSAKVVCDELHKAGWRLADLLKQALTSTSALAPAAEPIPQAPVSQQARP